MTRQDFSHAPNRLMGGKWGSQSDLSKKPDSSRKIRLDSVANGFADMVKLNFGWIAPVGAQLKSDLTSNASA
jgi:hypothetical protein